jgi:hypothetical protein
MSPRRAKLVKYYGISSTAPFLGGPDWQTFANTEGVYLSPLLTQYLLFDLIGRMRRYCDVLCKFLIAVSVIMGVVFVIFILNKYLAIRQSRGDTMSLFQRITAASSS